MNEPAAVFPEIEQILLRSSKTTPRAEHMEPFVAAARDVLEQELKTGVRPGKLGLANGSRTTHDVTAIVGITGELTGIAIYGMSAETAKAAVGQMLGSPVDELDELALSGIGELGNMITGNATSQLATAGLRVNITPPALLTGTNSRIVSTGIRRLVVPLHTSLGVIEAQIMVRSYPDAA